VAAVERSAGMSSPFRPGLLRAFQQRGLNGLWIQQQPAAGAQVGQSAGINF